MSGSKSTTPKALIRFLESKGFAVHRTKGSHVILKNETSGKRTVVPLHAKDLPKGTLHSILKQAGFSMEDLSR